MAGKKKKKSKKEIMLICNPEAGDPKESTTQLENATRLLMEQGLKVNVALARPKEVATRLAKKAMRKGYRVIVVMGGDGTIEAVTRAIVGSKIKVGLLPGGTENNIVHCLGLPDDIEGACKVIGEGSIRKIDVGQIQTKKARKFYFIEVTALGLIATLYPKGKKIAQGGIGNIGTVVDQFIHYQVPTMKVSIDGQPETEISSPLITISGTPTFGEGFLIAPDAQMEDGLLDVSIFSEMSKTQVITYFAAISGDKEATAPKVERYQVRKIRISTKPKQEIMADGVMLGKGWAKIKVRKNALRIFAVSQAAPQKKEQSESSGSNPG